MSRLAFLDFKLLRAPVLLLLASFSGSVFGENLETLDQILQSAGGVRAFLQSQQAQDEYFRALQEYYGKYQRQDFDEILASLKKLDRKVPGLVERLEETTDLGENFEIHSDSRTHGRGLDSELWQKFINGKKLSLTQQAGEFIFNSKGAPPALLEALEKLSKQEAQIFQAAAEQISQASNRAARKAIELDRSERLSALRNSPEAKKAAAAILLQYMNGEEFTDMVKSQNADIALAMIEDLNKAPVRMFSVLPTQAPPPAVLSALVRSLLPTQKELLASDAYSAMAQALEKALKEYPLVEGMDPELRRENQRRRNELRRRHYADFNHGRMFPIDFTVDQGGRVLESGSSDASGIVVKAIPRRFHGIFDGRWLGECVGCHPERWAVVALRGTQRHHIHINGQFAGFTNHIPVRIDGKTYASVEFGAPALRRKTVFVRDIDGKKIPTTLFEQWLQASQQTLPKHWSGRVVTNGSAINNAGVLETVINSDAYLGSTPVGVGKNAVIEDSLWKKIVSKTSKVDHGYGGRMVTDATVPGNAERSLVPLKPVSEHSVREYLANGDDGAAARILGSPKFADHPERDQWVETILQRGKADAELAQALNTRTWLDNPRMGQWIDRLLTRGTADAHLLALLEALAKTPRADNRAIVQKNMDALMNRPPTEELNLELGKFIRRLDSGWDPNQWLHDLVERRASTSALEEAMENIRAKATPELMELLLSRPIDDSASKNDSLLHHALSHNWFARALESHPGRDAFLEKFHRFTLAEIDRTFSFPRVLFKRWNRAPLDTAARKLIVYLKLVGQMPQAPPVSRQLDILRMLDKVYSTDSPRLASSATMLRDVPQSLWPRRLRKYVTKHKVNELWAQMLDLDDKKNKALLGQPQSVGLREQVFLHYPHKWVQEFSHLPFPSILSDSYGREYPYGQLLRRVAEGSLTDADKQVVIYLSDQGRLGPLFTWFNQDPAAAVAGLTKIHPHRGPKNLEVIEAAIREKNPRFIRGLYPPDSAATIRSSSELDKGLAALLEAFQPSQGADRFIELVNRESANPRLPERARPILSILIKHWDESQRGLLLENLPPIIEQTTPESLRAFVAEVLFEVAPWDPRTMTVVNDIVVRGRPDELAKKFQSAYSQRPVSNEFTQLVEEKRVPEVARQIHNGFVQTRGLLKPYWDVLRNAVPGWDVHERLLLYENLVESFWQDRVAGQVDNRAEAAKMASALMASDPYLAANQQFPAQYPKLAQYFGRIRDATKPKDSLAQSFTRHQLADEFAKQHLIEKVWAQGKHPKWFTDVLLDHWLAAPRGSDQTLRDGLRNSDLDKAQLSRLTHALLDFSDDTEKRVFLQSVLYGRPAFGQEDLDLIIAKAVDIARKQIDVTEMRRNKMGLGTTLFGHGMLLGGADPNEEHGHVNEPAEFHLLWENPRFAELEPQFETWLKSDDDGKRLLAFRILLRPRLQEANAHALVPLFEGWHSAPEPLRAAYRQAFLQSYLQGDRTLTANALSDLEKVLGLAPLADGTPQSRAERIAAGFTTVQSCQKALSELGQLAGPPN